MGTKQILESRQYGSGNIRSVEFQAVKPVQSLKKLNQVGDVLKEFTI